MTIPAGSTYASFNMTGVDDTATDGTQTVMLTASGPTFTSATATVLVYDNDIHHFGFSAIASPRATGVPFSVSITALDVGGLTINTFNGTAALSAAGAGGAVTITPASTTSFSGGYWTGDVAIGQVATNVAITAASGGASSSSGVFNVALSPAIAATPSIFSVSLPVGGTSVQTLNLANTGGGTLAWNIAGVSALIGDAIAGPVFAGVGAVVQDKTQPVQRGGAYTAPRIAAEALPVSALGTIPSVLLNLNANNGLVRSAIPNRYAFSDGVTGAFISDGGNDMYDGGNFFGTNLGASLNYSEGLIAANPPTAWPRVHTATRSPSSTPAMALEMPRDPWR